MTALRKTEFKTLYLTIPLLVYARWDQEGWSFGANLIFFGFTFYYNISPFYRDDRRTVLDLGLIPKIWLDEGGKYFWFNPRWDFTGRCL